MSGCLTEDSMFAFQQPTDPWTIINAIAGTLSAFAGLLSAVAALITVGVAVWTINRARQDKKQEDESHHPEFTALGTMGVLEESKSHYVEISFLNRGLNPAFQVFARVKILGPDYELVHVFESDSIEVIHANGSFDISDNDFDLAQEGKPHYLFIEMEYRDKRTQKAYKEQLYRQWPGLRALTSEPLRAMNQNELIYTQKAIADLDQRHAIVDKSL
jgi:hypothetical protein